MAAGAVNFKIYRDQIVIERNNMPDLSIEYDTFEMDSNRVVNMFMFSNYIIYFEKETILPVRERYTIRIINKAKTILLNEIVSKETFESILSGLSSALDGSPENNNSNSNNNDPTNPNNSNQAHIDMDAMNGGGRRRKTKKRRVNKKKKTHHRRR
jgi:hypothetical protein